MKKFNEPSSRRTPGEWDLNDFLHPARAFTLPRDVVDDSDLTLNEKRALLASWASDVCEFEAAGAVRHTLGTTQAVRSDDVMDALRALDQQANSHFRAPPHYRRVLKNRVPGVFGRKLRIRGPGRYGTSIS